MDDLVSKSKLIEKWDELSVRGRTEFDQVIMLTSTDYNLDVVVSKLEALAAEYEERANNKLLGAEKKKNLAKMHSYRYAYNIVKDGGIGEFKKTNNNG